jgi:hypothetical protein
VSRKCAENVVCTKRSSGKWNPALPASKPEGEIR